MFLYCIPNFFKMFKELKLLFTAAVAVIVISFAGCKSRYEKLLSSNDNSKKYSEAVKYYNRKEYKKALGLFDDLVSRYRGRVEAEDLFYYYACTNYKLGDNTSAPGQENINKAIGSLQLFINLYPKSDRVPEVGKLIQTLRDKLNGKQGDPEQKGK